MKARTRDIILLLLNTALFFTANQMMVTVLPLYVIFLGGNEQVVGLLVGLFFVSAVVFRGFFAKLSDRYGRKWLLNVAIFTSVTGPLLYLFNLGFWYLCLVRIYHGASLAAFMIASQTLLAELSTEENRGRLFGLYGIATGLAMAAAPSFGQYLAVKFGYVVFFSVTALCALLMVPGQILVKERQRGPEVEEIATVALKDIIRNRWVLIPSLSLFCITMVLGATSSFLPLHSAAVGIVEVGLYFAVFSLTYMASGYLAGAISDKFGRKVVVLPSFLLIALGLLALTKLTGTALLIMGGLFIGFGFGAANTALLVLVMDKTTLAERSQSVSFFNNNFDLGVSTGAMLLGGVAARSFSLVWGILAVITLFGFMLILFALPNDNRARRRYLANSSDGL